MSFASLANSYLNRLLRYGNMRLETLTAEKIEDERLLALKRREHFQNPVFHIPECFDNDFFISILEEFPRYKNRFESFRDSYKNEVGYTYDNSYFTSPDTEVLYTLVRRFQPKTFIEVGCGNTTKIIRQAVLDSNLDTHIISIDPNPRTEIVGLADKVIRQPVESLERIELFQSLKADDVLFIDSSHQVKTWNDVVFLYLKVIPELKPGVIIHIHDIFLPYDYPTRWIVEEKWDFSEQYLVQCILMFSEEFEVLWAGHYLQNTFAGFKEHFPNMNHQTAQSLWIRKKFKLKHTGG